MITRSPRRWIWAAVTIQCAGLAFDIVWHGLLNPGFEAATVAEMVRHLTAVHLPIYIGALSLFLTTAWPLIDWVRRSDRGGATPVAFAGACISVAGEGWHAYSHLQLSTHGAAIAGMASSVGLSVVIVALLASRRRGRRASDDIDHRRAA